MKRSLSFLLVVLLSFSLLCACERNSQLYYNDYETGATTEATELPIEVESLIPPLEEGAEVLAFRYDEKYLDLYYEKLAEYKDHALKDENMNTLNVLDVQLDELISFLQDQHTIAVVLYDCNMKDEEASQLYLDMTDMITEVQEATIEAMRDIYKSNSVLKDEIFDDYSDDDIQLLLDYNSEVKEISQRNSEIIVELHDMDEAQVENDIGALYSEMVSTYNRLAQIYGYDNYYDYAYDQEYSRDYTGDQVQLMRTYAKEYLLPAFTEAYDAYQVKFDSLSLIEYKRFVEFVTSDYDDVGYLDAYLEQLPEDVRTDMESLFDGNVVFPKSTDAMHGAFTTLINNHPFCYFSKGVRDTSTIVHEMGHYFASLYGDFDAMPLDLAEVQSQGHERLMIACMDRELKTDAYACYLDYRMVNDMGAILTSLIVDEFEERVYSSEGVENFTIEDFDQIMEEVCEGYGGIEFVKENITDIKSYWRKVALDHPVYYISYAVSLIPSIDIFFVADEDWDAGLDIYLSLTRDIEDDTTFLGALESAGLATPFETDVYEAIAARYEDQEEDSVA